jgi:predicted nucleotidyltransferase component of viral defense system
MTEIKNIPASINARLQNLARDQRKPFQEILQYYVIERFLYRLSCTKYNSKFVLKGGLVFYALGFPLRRPTRDIDFRGYTRNSEENLREIIKEACITAVPDDGLIFKEDTIQVEKIMTNTDYQGAHITVLAMLGTAKIPVQIDIGFTDLVTPEAQHLSFPVLLEDMEIPLLFGYPQESIISEKFHAMVRLEGVNSRWKDFYDVWMLSEQSNFQGKILQQAIFSTFQNRDTPIPIEVPFALSDNFARDRQNNWRAFLAKNQLLAGKNESFLFVIERLRVFLMPPVQALVTQQSFLKDWRAGAGWI